MAELADALDLGSSSVRSVGSSPTSRIGDIDDLAGVAQLVEHHVANVVVVGSNPITRLFYCRGHISLTAN